MEVTIDLPTGVLLKGSENVRDYVTDCRWMNGVSLAMTLVVTVNLVWSYVSVKQLNLTAEISKAENEEKVELWSVNPQIEADFKLGLTVF